MSYRLGIDVGGTFTDLVLFNDQSKKIVLAKVPSTPKDQAVGIMNGIEKITRQAGVTPDQIALLMHGTTVATNAVLEGKGAKTALITTEGFRDILHIMRQDRPKLYDFFVRRPDALIPRHLRFEVPERILYTGEIQTPLDERALAAVLRQIRAEGVVAVAVCLLHSYVNAAHEQRVRERILAACPGVEVSLSSDVLPEIKEYERMSTTAMNARVTPIVDRYFRSLREHLERAGIARTIHVMQSNGGIMPSTVAGQKSACTILSGPAAGVLGGVALARQAGFENSITVDMGGTSFDICLVDQGRPRFTRSSEIGGHALGIPMIDIHTIGAGGGSIAWTDQGGVLKVGPESAGADPGPACYLKGGSRPTVTDANLVLNRLDARSFLGGEMTVDREAALRAIEEKLAKPLGMDPMEVAEGIVRVVNANMVRGIRFVSVEKGYDPRDFTLVCFGGNGPLHGVELAKELNIPRILVPFAPGVNCAYGLLVADFRHDYVRTHIRKLSGARPADLNAIYGEMAAAGRAQMTAERIAAPSVVVHRMVDMRYQGQGYELEVPMGAGTITRKHLLEAERRFHVLHKKNYGFHKPGEETEIVNLRVTVMGVLPKPHLKRERVGPSDPRAALVGNRRVFLKGRFWDTRIYDRTRLAPGAAIRGPAIIEQKDSTTLLFPGDVARIDHYRNIVIRVGGAV